MIKSNVKVYENIKLTDHGNYTDKYRIMYYYNGGG